MLIEAFEDRILACEEWTDLCAFTIHLGGGCLSRGGRMTGWKIIGIVAVSKNVLVSREFMWLSLQFYLAFTMLKRRFD